MPRRKAHRDCQPDMTKKRMAASFRRARGGQLDQLELLPGLGEVDIGRSGFIFRNRTHLDSTRLRRMFLDSIPGWPTVGLSVLVRYSRGSDFSGACYYQTGRIFVNLGRSNSYPYRLLTYAAAARTTRFGWQREIHSLELADAYQLALFIFLHEFYHWLVKKAGRNTRQKEGMCDRFATRVLTDRWGAVLTDPDGRPVERSDWDFQDLDGFVAGALRHRR